MKHLVCPLSVTPTLVADPITTGTPPDAAEKSTRENGLTKIPDNPHVAAFMTTFSGFDAGSIAPVETIVGTSGDMICQSNTAT
jgi:hypothetical protein